MGGNGNEHRDSESVGVTANHPPPLDVGDDDEKRVDKDFKRALQGDGDSSDDNGGPMPLPASDAAGGGAGGSQAQG